MVLLHRPPFSGRKPAAEATASGGPPPGTSGGKGGQFVGATMALLAEAGCTLCTPAGPPSLSGDPHKFRRNLQSRFSADRSIIPTFLSGFYAYIRSPQNLRRVLIGSGNVSLVRALLLVGQIQSQLLRFLLERLPEYFVPLQCVDPSQIEEDIPRLILNHLKWLDFLVDAKGFAEKLLEVISISPIQFKKDIIGSLPEIIGDWKDESLISALQQMLQEDLEIAVPVLDAFSNLNLDDQLQEQVVTIAISCIRTINAEHMPFLLKFLLLSATPANVGRIISHIREHLKFICLPDSAAARHKKFKGKSLADNAEVSIIEALRTSLLFKNILSEAVLKELRCIDKPCDHKVIDVWFLILIYSNGGSLQKSVEKIIKRKIIDGSVQKSLFDQCIHRQRALVQDYFPPFLSVCEYLVACKEQQAREFGIYLYMSLFEEFVDTYFRQEILGALVTHIGSGICYQVNSALETMILLTSKYSQELLPLSSYITGILDYMEGFSDESLHKVYEIFSKLVLSACSDTDSGGSSIANELMMIVQKQVGSMDLKYKRMGIIGTLKLVYFLGDINLANCFSLSQRTTSEEALELLKMSLDSCKSLPLLLILFYDELISLVESATLQPKIIEWTVKHTGEFESKFLSDLESGQLLVKDSSDGLDGELWMNLDGDLTPICVNILPLLGSSMQQSSLQILPVNFLLLSAVERLTNQGTLGGIDALLGCPLHLPSPKYFATAAWKSLTGTRKQIVCLSLYYAINWIRELLNAFCTQVAGEVDCITQATKEETISKLLKRLRNLVCLEGLLNAVLKLYPISLPELHCCVDYSRSSSSIPIHLRRTEKKTEWNKISQGTSLCNKRKRKSKPTAPDVNGRLCQPTILDCLKRAGAVISQEVPSEGSSVLLSKEKALESGEDQSYKKQELVETSAVDAHRLKFRPLHVDCLSILSFTEARDSCCADSAAELPLHLYLLLDFHYKLDYLAPPRKPFSPASSLMNYKAPPGLGRMTATEFLNKIKPLFSSLKKHLDCACIVLKEGSTTCQEHWKTQSACAGNPDISFLVASTSLVAGSVAREVLCCFRKMVNLPDTFLQNSVLMDLLGAFQPIRIAADICSGIQPFPLPGSMEHLYCGTYSFFEDLLEKACSSFLLASEVVMTLESLVKSTQLFLDKIPEGNSKHARVGFIQSGIQPFLRKRLGTCAHKLLVYDWDSNNHEYDWKSKGDTIQRILHIYFRNMDSTSNLLNEVACSVLPQVPSCKTRSTQDATLQGYPALCPVTFIIWYRVLHEENLIVLNNWIKEIGVLEKCRAAVQAETIKRQLINLRQSVNVVVALVNLCKTHDKVTVHAMAVKYGGKFIDLFLKVFGFLCTQLKEHNDDIVQLVRELQKATRTIQTLCSEAKGSKKTMITSKIPATKRSLERFLFHVKALLHNTSSVGTFWIGNLKHKDLYGQEVSSQAYTNGDEEAENEREDEDVSDGQGQEDEEMDQVHDKIPLDA